MFNNENGSTLIESLLAFEIFITTLVLFVSLFIQILHQENQIQKNYITLLEKEEELIYEDDFIGIIEMVLH
jgi:hypothetical protein